MLKRALVLGIIAGGFATSLALAQLPNLANLFHKSNGGSIVAQQDGLVRSYVSANKDVLVANAKMADAVVAAWSGARNP